MAALTAAIHNLYLQRVFLRLKAAGNIGSQAIYRLTRDTDALVLCHDPRLFAEVRWPLLQWARDNPEGQS